MLGDASLLAASGEMLRGLGVRRLAVSRPRRHLKVEERWTSRGLKPYFNDIVVHNGHADEHEIVEHGRKQPDERFEERAIGISHAAVSGAAS